MHGNDACCFTTAAANAVREGKRLSRRGGDVGKDRCAVLQSLVQRSGKGKEGGGVSAARAATVAALFRHSPIEKR